MTEKAKPPSQAKPPHEKSAEPKVDQDDELDQELEDSFPASDPPSMTQPKTSAGAPDHKAEKKK